MRRFFILFLLSIFILGSLFCVEKASADELSDINDKLNKLNESLSESKKKKEANESELKKINNDLEEIKSQVNIIEANISVKEKEIEAGEEKLIDRKKLLDERVVSFYKQKSRSKDMLLDLLVADNFSSFIHQFTYQNILLENDKRQIITTAVLIQEVENKKTQLETEKARLEPIKQEISKQSEYLSGQVASAVSEQQDIQRAIADLSARQQEIIRERSGGFTVNTGSSELSDHYSSSLNSFRTSAPAGSFAVFSFGAYTHRKGMSQYGAKGRAGDGQNYKDILKYYYGKEPVNKETGGGINVSGYGEIDFETAYLYGISEMPSSWHPEALKAQAIAARTYAYRYKTENKEICTTESCQVFRKDKSDNPPDSWKQAVDDTRGQVLEDVVTFYSSTTGGYLTTSGWDTTDSSGGENFLEKSYEKKGDSPWLYKAWYTQSYSVNSDTCGRSGPWLSAEEMADIVNAALVLKKGTSEEASRISPVSSCWSGNPYSMAELREVAGKYGGISSVSSVSVSQGDGVTNSVNIEGVTISGSDFKKAFNLRAPGRLSIPQGSFSFFNIERK